MAVPRTLPLGALLPVVFTASAHGLDLLPSRVDAPPAVRPNLAIGDACCHGSYDTPDDAAPECCRLTRDASNPGNRPCPSTDRVNVFLKAP